MPAKPKSPVAKTAAAKPAAAKSAAKTSPVVGSLKKGDHVFLVDGSGYIFRAYHALPPLTRKSDGLQINAVLGFCNMLWKLLNDMKPEERPTHLAVVFDKSEKTFRTDFYPEYKAQRPDIPGDLIPQFPLIREAVRAFDIPCLEQAGFEADDIIATYARLACEAQATATIVSSDKDLMQLVNDCVTMYDTMKDKRIGRAEVIEKFGVGPEKVIEVQALIGDFERQCAGRARHRRQDGSATHHRVWRSGNPAPARRRDQTGQATADADRQCGNRAHFQAAGHARPARQSRSAGRRPRRARAGLQEPRRLSQGDGIQHADATGRREIRHRRQ